MENTLVSLNSKWWHRLFFLAWLVSFAFSAYVALFSLEPALAAVTILIFIGIRSAYYYIVLGTFWPKRVGHERTKFEGITFGSLKTKWWHRLLTVAWLVSLCITIGICVAGWLPGIMDILTSLKETGRPDYMSELTGLVKDIAVWQESGRSMVLRELRVELIIDLLSILVISLIFVVIQRTYYYVALGTFRPNKKNLGERLEIKEMSLAQHSTKWRRLLFGVLLVIVCIFTTMSLVSFIVAAYPYWLG